MIKAVLFDLDGTLLPFDRQTFEKGYFKIVMNTFDNSKGLFIAKTVMESVAVMTKNHGPLTNQQVFEQYFCSIVNDLPFEYYDEHFTQMYETSFQQLKQIYEIEPKANALIQLVKNKGKQVILATNPLFPKVATYSRMSWAGLDTSLFDYVTTYENSIAAKPDPYYFRNLLNTLNLKEDEVVLVGNDCIEDGCAQQLGIQVYIINKTVENPQFLDKMDFVGSIDEVMNQLESVL